jgi:ubiquinone/menaquinone biosynthesis C-methylase UbiE
MNTGQKNNVFNQRYFALRDKEGRIMTDEELQHLPEVFPGHPYAQEWKLRASSCGQLKHYLEKKDKPLSILEVGCGNGWLSHRLSYIQQSQILALDINKQELCQAERVFAHKKNIKFCLGTIHDLLAGLRFDVIIFAASIQYFPDFKKTISTCLDVLENGGELHILDSKFYGENEVAEAKLRSLDYFQSVNEPEMQQFYFHHCFDVLHNFKFRILYNPHSLVNKLLKNASPFYWIRIDK